MPALPSDRNVIPKLKVMIINRLTFSTFSLCLVVQRMDNALRWKAHLPLDSQHPYPLASDLSTV